MHKCLGDNVCNVPGVDKPCVLRHDDTMWVVTVRSTALQSDQNVIRIQVACAETAHRLYARCIGRGWIATIADVKSSDLAVRCDYEMMEAQELLKILLAN